MLYLGIRTYERKKIKSHLIIFVCTYVCVYMYILNIDLLFQLLIHSKSKFSKGHRYAMLTEYVEHNFIQVCSCFLIHEYLKDTLFYKTYILK